MTDFASLLFEIVRDLDLLASDAPVPRALIRRMEECLGVGLLVVSEMAPRWSPPDFIVKSGRLERARSKLSVDQLHAIRTANADETACVECRDLMVRLAHALDAAQEASTMDARGRMQ